MTPKDEARTSQNSTGNSKLDAEAERLLRDIESTSPFVLRTSNPEDLDPSDVGEPAVPGTRQAADGTERVPEGFEEETHVDEPAFHIATDAERALEVQQEQEKAEEEAQQRRHRLRNTLIVVVFVLLIVAGGIGAFIFGANIGNDSSQPQTQTMPADNPEAESTSFQPVDPSMLPKLATLFGSGLEEVESATRGKLAVSNDIQEQRQGDVASMRYSVAASITTVSGETAANVTLGLDENKRLVYVHSSFDLDVLQVADADFRALASDGTVAASLLTGMGVDAVSAPPSALSVKDGAINTLGDVENCEFDGETGLDTAPQTWKLLESYDHAAGKAAGDNRVMRTIVVELV